MTARLTDEECRVAAQEALDALPPEMAEQLGDVAVIVERIVIFRDANPNADEVRRTVLHEVGHYFGMGEEQLAELGYG